MQWIHKYIISPVPHTFIFGINWPKMTSSNGNIFRVTGLLGSGTELWRFLWAVPEQTVEQTVETPAILDTIALIMTSL